MPTYGYRCEKNGHEFEVVQGINDEPLTRCQVCGSKVRRIFYPVGIVFKGPGFYKTDSRSGSAITGGDSDSKGSSTDKAGGDKSTSDKSSGDSTAKAGAAKKAELKKTKGDSKAGKSA
jgi:putative FmdB family regulatory protein